MDALAVAGPVYIERQHFCSKCGRFLSASWVAGDLKPGMVRSRSYCRNCGKWRWYDVTDGILKTA